MCAKPFNTVEFLSSRVRGTDTILRDAKGSLCTLPEVPLFDINAGNAISTTGIRSESGRVAASLMAELRRSKMQRSAFSAATTTAFRSLMISIAEVAHGTRSTGYTSRLAKFK
jgi:hypothetical protein